MKARVWRIENLSKIPRLDLAFMSWCYHHARWFYKWASGYAYELNCQIEELSDEIEALQKRLNEQIDINKLIEAKCYE